MAKRDSTRSKGKAAPCPCGERRMKVYSEHYDYRPKGDPSPYLVSRPVPWIQLKGYWLAQAGFAIAAKLKVRVMKGCLVVTVEREDK